MPHSIQSDITPMLDPANEMIVDLATSCTRQVAAAKLLGWMRGPIYPRYVQVTDGGAPIDQQPFLASPEDSLADQLTLLLEDERQRVLDAYENNASSEVCESRLDELLKWEKQIDQAAAYLRDIDDELNKEGESELKLDRLISSDVYITLSSLDKWALRKYKISIFDPPLPQANGTSSPSSAPSNATSANIDPSLPQTTPVESALQVQPNAIAITEQATVPTGVTLRPHPEGELIYEGALSKLKADNVFTTLAFLVDVFSESGPLYRTGDRPNADTIADRIQQEALKAHMNQPLSGQRAETIRKVIAEAQKRKKLVLRKSGISTDP